MSDFQEVEFDGDIFEFPVDMSDDEIGVALNGLRLEAKALTQESTSFFDDAFQETLGNEGGYVNDPDDPGGETNFGISKRSYPNVDIKALTEEQAKEIYRRDFWKYGDMGREVGMKMFDMAVNFGPGAANKMLQRVVGAKDDGVIGPKTLSKVASMSSEDILNGLVSESVNRYNSIAKARPASKKFLNGWLARARRLPAPVIVETTEQKQSDSAGLQEAEEQALDIAAKRKAFLRRLSAKLPGELELLAEEVGISNIEDLF